MKTRILLCISFFFCSLVLKAQIKIQSDGDIGLGTTSPSGDINLKGDDIRINFTNPYAQYIKIHPYNGTSPVIEPSQASSGYLGCNNQWYKIKGKYIYLDGTLLTSSDSRLKENIVSISNPLDKILLLRGVKYDLRPETYENAPEELIPEIEKMSKDNLGIIAQEALPIIPEIIHYDEEKDEYGVNYLGLIPVLIEAIKEQQTQIEDLKSRLPSTEPKLKSLTTSEDNPISENQNTAYLENNKPNPFNENTTINYRLPTETKDAQLLMFDMNGKQVRNFKINEFGSSKIIIQGNELEAGMYFYTLVADGREVDTKRMILTR